MLGFPKNLFKTIWVLKTRLTITGYMAMNIVGGPGGVLRYISDGDVRMRRNC